ncbi:MULTISPECIES: hypothetical protein [unclassified Streptomyces]|uniref:hypothetical protein n=1 Tax=unclassified Streptomyces TaxID=2593676 RepID=UPI0038199FD0
MDWWGSLGLERGRLVHFLLACGLCVLALLLTAVTWLSGPDSVPRAAMAALVLPVFPVFGAALFRALHSGSAARLLGRGNGGRLLWFVWDLPARLKWFYAVVFALSVLGFAGAGTEDVRTDAHGVHYVVRKDAADPRGERVVLTDAEYDRAEWRPLTAGVAIFYAMSSFVVLAAASLQPFEFAETDPERPW